MEVEMAAVPRFRQQGSGLEGHRTNLRSKWCESHPQRSEEHTSELQSPCNLVCRLLLEKKKHRDVSRDDLYQVLERGVAEHRAHARINAALRAEIVARGRQDVVLLRLQLAEVAAHPVEHEALQIEHPLATLGVGRDQQVHEIRMVDEELRMIAQIGFDLVRTFFCKSRVFHGFPLVYPSPGFPR